MKKICSYKQGKTKAHRTIHFLFNKIEDFISITFEFANPGRKLEEINNNGRYSFFFFLISFLFIYRFHSNYHHHSGWNPPETPPESVTSAPTSDIRQLANNNNNNHSNGNGATIGATNSTNAILATANSAINYRDGQFFEQSCHMDAGSPNGSLASASPPSAIGTHTHSTNHLSNYRPHISYYPV